MATGTATSTDTTLFDVPTNPEQFSVLLPAAILRKLDFTALDFPTARRAVVEYIKTYFPNDFNDFVANNGIIMLIETMSMLVAALSLREDIIANEGFLPTAQTEDAITNHLALIDQKIKPATPATVDVECSLSTPLTADVMISPIDLQPFQVRGDDGASIFYELFSAPDDLTSDIVIPASKRGVIAFGLEGQTQTSTSVLDGLANTTVKIANNNILGAPIRVTIQLSSGATPEEWTRVDSIQQAGASDKVFEAIVISNELQISFGDNITGRIPAANSTATVTYRTGGGSRGRIGAGLIDTQRPVTPQYPYNAPVMVAFRNLQPSTGGTDKESLDAAKQRAPKDFATQGTAVTQNDYAQLAGSFSHPTFGTVSKAVASVRTGLNANLVEVYVLAEGPGGLAAQPSQGLKLALANYLDEINVITDSVSVLDGCIHPVDVKMSVVMNKNTDASIVKVNVEAAVDTFFDIANWQMGQALYVSQLYELINAIDGVSYVDVFSPADNILPSGLISVQAEGPQGTLEDVSPQIGINAVVTIGDKEISYYYEAGR